MNYDICTNTTDDSNFSLADELYPNALTVWKELETLDYIKIIAYALVIIGGLLGNISVILTVALNRSMRTTINFYVANLAVADALICIICMIPQTLNVATLDVYIFGEFMCKFNPFTQMTCLTSSVLTLSAISCDRFIAIMFPLHVRITKQRTSVVMTIVWMVSCIVSIPFLIIKKHIVIEWKDFSEPKCSEEWPVYFVYDEELGTCVNVESYRQLYYMLVSITLFFLPVLIMITAYSLILWRLRVAQVPGEQHQANVNVHSRARKKVNKMVFFVLVAFITCWTPLQVMVLYSAFIHKDYDGPLPEWFADFKWFAYFLAYANSFINPIIYGGFNKTFRDGFCMVLRCGYSGNRFGRPEISGMQVFLVDLHHLRPQGSGELKRARSRMTFTTGVTSSPSRNTSKTLNGANKTSLKSNMEMKLIYPVTDGDLSPTVRDTCVSIAETRD